jgi:hypothetical protein
MFPATRMTKVAKALIGRSPPGLMNQSIRMMAGAPARPRSRQGARRARDSAAAGMEPRSDGFLVKACECV